jgi:hypothetical protein
MMNRLRHRVTKPLTIIPAVARSKDSFASANSAIVAVAILAIWLTVVIFTATRHEFWRDEVRPLSLVRAASSPLDLYGLTKYDGHPILWFLLLYIGNSIVDTPVVLPATSIIIAFAAVAVFMFFSPFPFWIRCLFIFSALPFYEYSVMCRNYGISMLLVFVGAVLYPNRAKYPLSLAFVLALLANTNVHSAILACLIAALWAWDTGVEQTTASVQKGRSSFYLPFAIVVAGVLLCAVFAMPRENTILTPIRHGISMRDLAYSLLGAVLRPEDTFSQIVPAMLPPSVAAALLYLATFGLLHRRNLFLAALGGQIAFGVLFRVVYPGEYRHQGLFLVFILFLYWLFAASLDNEAMTRNKGSMTKNKKLMAKKRRVVTENKGAMTGTRPPLFNAGLYVAVLILIAGNVAKTKDAVWADINQEMSSSRALGEYLNRSEAYRDAVIVPEPDYLIESLAYYAKNRIYLPREQRFGGTVSWTTEAKYRLSLGELLSVARDIQGRFGQPVLIVLGHWEVGRFGSAEKKYSYNKVFSWDTKESADFNESTILVGEFKSAYGDENYRVYAVR